MKSDIESGDWVENELKNVQFGDRRLGSRSIKILRSLSENPQASIPEAHGNWGDCFAAYRFLNNEKVSHKKILESHSNATLERMSHHPVVLILHDSSSLNYSGLSTTTGLGNVGDSKHRDAKGLIFHTTYAVTPSRIPLGVLDQQIWDRQKSELHNTTIRRKTSIEKKESGKWLTGVRNISSQLNNLSKTKCIHIADREADIYELFTETQHLDQSFIIRARHNRKINKNSRGARYDGSRLLEEMSEQDPLAIIDLEVSSRGGIEPTREAKVEVRSLRFKLTAPKDLSKTKHNFMYDAVEMTAISVHEIDVDEDGTEQSIDWILLTNVPIISAEQALICVDYYACRWQIEVFHRTLKTGCKVEDCRLSSGKRIEAFVALLSIVAWRLHWLSIFSRIFPKGNPENIFTEKEQKILCMVVNKEKHRKTLKAQDYVILLARLGGFLNRKHDGFPGPEVLWRGWRKLKDIIESLAQMEDVTGNTYV